MSYATVAQAIELYGDTTIRRACDRDLDDTLDLSSFERHLEIASQEMDGYMLGRYPLPLELAYTVPAIFVKRCVDIALYNCVRDADVRSDEDRRRFDDAIKYMELIAANKVKIPLASPVTGDPVNVPNESQAASTVRGRAIHSTYPARVFTPDNVRRIL